MSKVATNVVACAIVKTDQERGPFGTWLRTQRMAHYGTKPEAAVADLRRAGQVIGLSQFKEYESGTRQPTKDHRRALEDFFRSAPPAPVAPALGDLAPVLARIATAMEQQLEESRQFRYVLAALVTALGERDAASEGRAETLMRAIVEIQRVVAPGPARPARYPAVGRRLPRGPPAVACGMTALTLRRFPGARVATLMLFAILGIVNAILLGAQLGDLPKPGSDVDFAMFARAADLIRAGVSPFAIGHEYAFRWSPIAAYALIPLTALGIWAWRAAQLAAALTLPDRRMTFVVLVSWPFWFDFQLGNVLTFAVWLAAWALAGRRWAAYGYLALCLLVPRPLMAPVALWLLWKRPELRPPVVAMAIVSVAAAAATGLLPAWLDILRASTGELPNDYNIAPSRWIGSVWIVVGLPLAALAMWRGRLGLASLLASPYLLPYYLLFGVLELRHAREEDQPVVAM